MKFDTPIAAAAKRMMMLTQTGYLTPEFRRDIETLMQGAMAYEVMADMAQQPVIPVAGQAPLGK